MDGPFVGIFQQFLGKAMGPDYLWDEHIPENQNTQRINIKNFYKDFSKFSKLSERYVNTKNYCVFITIKHCANM